MTAAVPAKDGQRTPALQAIVHTILHGTEGMESAAAQRALQAFCHGNAEGQKALAATLTPVGDTSMPGTVTVQKQWWKQLSSKLSEGAASACCAQCFPCS